MRRRLGRCSFTASSGRRRSRRATRARSRTRPVDSAAAGAGGSAGGEARGARRRGGDYHRTHPSPAKGTPARRWPTAVIAADGSARRGCPSSSTKPRSQVHSGRGPICPAQRAGFTIFNCMKMSSRPDKVFDRAALSERCGSMRRHAGARRDVLAQFELASDETHRRYSAGS